MFSSLLILFGACLFRNVLNKVNGQTPTATTPYPSPCPDIFGYEPIRDSEPDKLYGVVTLMRNTELSGVWLRLQFDRPSIQLGNWFGEVSARDGNTLYVIKNRNYKLEKGKSLTIRFYVRFDRNKAPPRLTAILINGQTVCPYTDLVSTAAAPDMGTPLTSSVQSTTSSTPPTDNKSSTSTSTQSVQPGGGFQLPPTSISEEDDYFPGDFNLIGRPNTPDESESNCGTIVVSPSQTSTTHGQTSTEGEFPWHAALYHSEGSDVTYLCGASLISKQHLITVAHCVTHQKTTTPLPNDTMLSYLGKHYLRSWSNVGIQNKLIDSIHVHPQYDPNTFAYDLAILRLSQPVEITDFVRPVCLWNEPTDLSRVVGKTGTVIGWGIDKTGHLIKHLTQSQMNILLQQTCIYSFPDVYSRSSSTHIFCAGFKNGTSVCNGDSGNGMVLPRSTYGVSSSPVWQLRGMVSFSMASKNQFKCDPRHYVVFTDIARYTEWIRRLLK